MYMYGVSAKIPSVESDHQEMESSIKQSPQRHIYMLCEIILAVEEKIFKDMLHCTWQNINLHSKSPFPGK